MIDRLRRPVIPVAAFYIQGNDFTDSTSEYHYQVF